MSIESYVNDRYFAFNFEFNPNDYSRVDCQPHYKFNCVERLGNALLTPLDKCFKKIDQELTRNNGDYDSEMGKICWGVAVLFSSVLALIGATIKKLGEWANANSALRQEALKKLREINAFNKTKVIDELGNLNIGCTKAFLDMDFMRDHANCGNLTELRKQWGEIWNQITQKFIKQEDFSEEKERLKEITAKNAKTQKAALKLCEELNEKMNQMKSVRAACNEYNRMVRQMDSRSHMVKVSV